MSATPDPASPPARWAAPATPEHVTELRRTAVAHLTRLGLFAGRVDEMAVAISEALTNAAVHAYRETDTGSMMLAISPVAGGVLISVCDEGVGLTPRPDSPGLGLGLPLVAQFADDFAVHPGPGGRGTEVTMTFRDHSAR